MDAALRLIMDLDRRGADRRGEEEHVLVLGTSCGSTSPFLLLLVPVLVVGLMTSDFALDRGGTVKDFGVDVDETLLVGGVRLPLVLRALFVTKPALYFSKAVRFFCALVRACLGAAMLPAHCKAK